MSYTDYALRVGDLMTLEPIVVAVDALVEDAERLILEFGVSGLPVVDDDDRVVGVVSQTDFMHLGSPDLRYVIRGKPDGLRVGEVMAHPALTVKVSTTLGDAARIMLDERVHRVVVIDDSDRAVGVLSAIDYVKLYADE